MAKRSKITPPAQSQLKESPGFIGPAALVHGWQRELEERIARRCRNRKTALAFRMETCFFLLQQAVDLAHEGEHFLRVLLFRGARAQFEATLLGFVFHVTVTCNLVTNSPEARKRFITNGLRRVSDRNPWTHRRVRKASLCVGEGTDNRRFQSKKKCSFYCMVFNAAIRGNEWTPLLGSNVWA
jgi:hypothetical protein